MNNMTINKDCYKSSKSAPIGLFDSGVGGLSVFCHLQKVLPNEYYLYYADTLHVPYGNRSSSQISDLTLNAVDWLVKNGCKLIVIACNSASAHGLELARKCYPLIPIVGLVPALKPAIKLSKNKKVAILATKATLEGHLLKQVIQEVAVPNDTQVFKWFEPDLVPWVELGMPKDSQTVVKLRNQLYRFSEKGVDSLVLGCTHYPFFRNFLMSEIKAMGLAIKVSDSGSAIASRVLDLLEQKGLLSDTIGDDSSKAKTPIKNRKQWQTIAQLEIGSLFFYASDYNSSLEKVVRRLINTNNAC